MKKSRRVMPVILVIAASFAGYISLPGAGYPPGGGSYSDSGIQQYSSSPQEYGRNEDTSYFYDRLSPYGNWIDLHPYGYVWTPRHMGYRWRPYSDGHWFWADDHGWTWIADQEWGDIPFHYGRWGWDNDIGWFWVPGTVWGPAWVTWRSNDQYMGWAPLPPGVEVRAGMSFASPSIDIPLNFWIFIQAAHFQDRNLNLYVLPFERNRTIVNNTIMHNNIYVRNDRIIYEGIGLDEVRRITGRTVPRYELQYAQQSGRTRVVGQEIQIFRPAIKQNQAAKPKVYLNRDQARQELATARVFDPQGQQTINTEAEAVQWRQLEEMRLLEMSQAQEIKDMQQKRAVEEQRFRDASEKAKVNRDYEAKISDFKKNFAVERQQMTVRHKNDAEQVMKVKQTMPGIKNKINT